MRLLLATLALAGALSLVLCVPAYAQANHERGHANYQNWINGRDQGCCNNQDCNALSPLSERVRAGQLEVRIEGEWCPVLSWHYLKKGNAPDWQTAHVCVAHKSRMDWESGESIEDPRGPCERLLCYQPKPLF